MSGQEVVAGSRGIRTWLPLVVLALFPLAALRARFGPVGDPDAFWHILGGRHVLGGGGFASPDPYGTFTRGAWVLHEWLPEVAMAWFAAHLGLGGVAWLGFAGVLAILVAIHATCRTQADPLAAVVAAAVGWVGTSGSLGPRPQLVSFVLLAVTVGAWLRTAADGRPRWWLVPLTWLWACAHGLWLVGPVVGVVVVAGLAIDSDTPRTVLRRLAWIPLASVAIGALTPVGPRLLLTPAHVSGYARFVTEWNPPSIRDPFVIAAVAMLASVAVGWARRRERVRPHVLGLWLVALGATLVYARTVAIGAIIAAPLFAAACQQVIGPRMQRTRRLERAALALGVIIALTVAGVAARGYDEPVGVPTGLSARLDALPEGTVVLDDYALGGWLLWAHPELRPVVDPRTDLYPIDYLDRYAAALSAGPGWQAFVEETKPGAALLRESSPLAGALVAVRGWRSLGTDAGYDLIIAPGRQT